jgi:hypothetical protein
MKDKVKVFSGVGQFLVLKCQINSGLAKASFSDRKSPYKP